MDDSDDLFLDFENSTCDNLNVSANLLSVIGASSASQTSIDRVSKAEWVAPAVSGLKNSRTTLRGKHWYRDDDFPNKPDSNKPRKMVQWAREHTFLLDPDSHSVAPFSTRKLARS